MALVHTGWNPAQVADILEPYISMYGIGGTLPNSRVYTLNEPRWCAV